MTYKLPPDPDLDPLLEFLYGAEAHDGQWFSDPPPAGKPRYWWRSKLREAVKNARLQAYRDGLEEAAKTCEDVNLEYGEHPEMALTCASAIRSLKEKSNAV